MILQFNGVRNAGGHQFEVLFKRLNASTKRNDQTDLLLMSTPRKINMEHNHGGLEDDLPF